MILEKVLPHLNRPDTFINIIITPHEKVNEYDKFIIRQIIFNEFEINKSS